MCSRTWKDGLHQHWNQLVLAGEPTSTTQSVEQAGGTERGHSSCRMLWCLFSSAEPATEGVGMSQQQKMEFSKISSAPGLGMI